MGARTGQETDAVAFLAALAAAPHRFDFYQTLRRLECLYSEKPRWGCARRPIDEPVRLGQDPDLSFAPAPLSSFDTSAGRVPRLGVRLFGLLGPNGPLPLHITEYARGRLRRAGQASDSTLVNFLDLFQHRFVAFFYRAWAQAQPHVNRDRPDSDRFAAYVGAFLGAEPASLRNRDAVPDEGKFFHAGVLIRHVRNAEGLATILQQFFRVPAQIEEFVGHWLGLSVGERTRLGREGATLGLGAVLGSRVWDRQHKFRIRLGPLSFEQYERFLPAPATLESGNVGFTSTQRRKNDGRALRKLVDWVRLYLSFELDWDVQLLLEAAEVPPLRLGAGPRLGWTSWLGSRREDNYASELCLDAEAFVDRVGVPAA
ncbi:MAG: type VI secretion system baseplate subunit TssG [Acidobacteria bacterium]|jgi:type VI secretion system protein ImpH|nr:type VI secretion system baseplate subunit TssG [Acidobacteriota bacterium]MDP7480101.1 type VI secretion system baseplate subunit TssG [Vicinamibacterales bacterium]HJN44510.1 type VI secretion system baseplate subunit TssG [Vicinamibacterales bacterium]|tara:strand:- start:945 stop:2057 length:1113 start_codon:yes stop_codon:yes gene_type:complete